MTSLLWLVACDFSEASEAAARLAAAEAAEQQGSVLLLHTFVEPHVPGSYKWASSEGFASQEELYTALTDEIAAALQENARDLREIHHELHIETLVNRGDPREQIVAVATERGVHRVFMGTHSRAGLDRYLVGSVTDEVVRNAPMPVTVVKAPAPRG